LWFVLRKKKEKGGGGGGGGGGKDRGTNKLEGKEEGRLQERSS